VRQVLPEVSTQLGLPSNGHSTVYVLLALVGVKSYVGGAGREMELSAQRAASASLSFSLAAIASRAARSCGCYES